MNFYILSNNSHDISTLQTIIESDFSNSIVGIDSTIENAYDDLLQLRVDVLLINCDEDAPTDGLKLIERLHSVHIKPNIIMIGAARNQSIKEDAYRQGIDFYLEKPLNPIEVQHVTRLVASYRYLITKMAEISKITSSFATPLKQPQSQHRIQTERVYSLLRFLGIASEKGNTDIIRIIRVMIEQNVSFSNLDFERDLSLDPQNKKITFQRIRRAIRIGISNLAAMCNEYPENEILFEYANSLFEYQNVSIEIQKIRHNDVPRNQISIQHFFDGLLQESLSDSSK